MTEEERQANIEIDAAMRCFDPPAGDPGKPEEPEIPEKPEPGKPEKEPDAEPMEDPDIEEPEERKPQPEHAEAGERPSDHLTVEDRREEHVTAGDQPEPNWASTEEVVRWYGRMIARLSRRKESLAKLRAVSNAVSTLTGLLRLHNDSQELESVKRELAELRRMIEGDGLRVVK